eukprot:scaffold1342_cov115-Skeletonema_dohrnii-CCMP3373.AAC.6
MKSGGSQARVRAHAHEANLSTHDRTKPCRGQSDEELRSLQGRIERLMVMKSCCKIKMHIYLNKACC